MISNSKHFSLLKKPNNNIKTAHQNRTYMLNVVIRPMTSKLHLNMLICYCNQPRPQSNFKEIALAPDEFAGNFYLI